LFYRGLALQKLDKKEKAIDDFANALENLNDDDAKFQAYFQKGICLRRLGDLKNSI
jgi:tetratricopeptide (TPR) repeat protein